MAKFLSDNSWKRYQGIIKDFMDIDAGLQPMTYRKARQVPLAFGEDAGQKYDDYTINVLCNYNSFRTWPVDMPTVSGTKDMMNLAIMVTKENIEVHNLLDNEGYWKIDGPNDIFIINGNTYSAQGDTQVAQAKDKPMIFQVILQRKETTKEE